MVIQRWQNLLLLIAVVLMCVFCSTPYAIDRAAETPAEVYVSDAPVFLVINLVIAALLVIAIFLFRDLRRQMTVTLITIVLVCASIVTCGFIMYAYMPDAELIWTGGVLLLIASLVCAGAAYRFMSKDRALLRSYDRLR
ncbi:MAG: DUF4293 family protein [Muribaculaceae bacterium]|nr:DUF4293 family protein [Muribaculaceae bacterium]MDE6197454.1 DUF4293 family protein [Muribaculaceae bacterium]